MKRFLFMLLFLSSNYYLEATKNTSAKENLTVFSLGPSQIENVIYFKLEGNANIVYYGIQQSENPNNVLTLGMKVIIPGAAATFFPFGEKLSKIVDLSNIEIIK